MTYTPATFRPVLVEILVGMAEIAESQGANLVARPESDLNLAQLNFDSLTMLDFCLKVETATGIVLDPDELVEFTSLRQLEALMLTKQSG